MGEFTRAASDLHRMESLREEAAEVSPYWADQIEIQRLSALAWLQHQKEERDAAIDTMRKAAAMEAATEKHPITPGEILPARELLADMLRERGEYEAALKEYRASLERSPGRFNSLYGAGRAAERAGQKKEATLFYRQLVSMASSDSDREELQHAKGFLKE